MNPAGGNTIPVAMPCTCILFLAYSGEPYERVCVTGNNVILDSPSAPPASSPASAAGEPMRPKAFRRPPGWVAPTAAASPTATPQPAAGRQPAATLAAAVLAPRHDKLYGLFLIALVIGVNLLAASLLSVWQPHAKPRYSFSAPQGMSFEKTESLPQRDNVTLYASPPDARRTLRLDALDTPFDSTDAAWQPPANPADDQ